ncbi:hypothetical protein F4802DRAFT_590741 [Xylaria palmicola]|nr:hypothetical protein F4802DRAFT_590741 [Xylaria palmicola]
MASFWSSTSPPSQVEEPGSYRHKRFFSQRSRHGRLPVFISSLCTIYPMNRHGNQLPGSGMKSELLPPQRAVLAMSPTQYLAHLPPVFVDRQQDAQQNVPTPEDPGGGSDDDDDGGGGDRHADEKAESISRPTQSPMPADRLLVGVCIFRLDAETLQPAVLLVRRSPLWWRQHIFTSVGGGQGAGQWELPGGRVASDDFCISAAMERLVREKIGLRVTKVMVQLPNVRWSTEWKALHWDEEQNGESTRSASEGGGANGGADDGDGDRERLVEIRVDQGAYEWSESTSSISTGGSRSGKATGRSSKYDDGGGVSSEETLALTPPAPPSSYELEILGIHIPADPSWSLGSSSARLTSDSELSSFLSPPLSIPARPAGSHDDIGGGRYSEYEGRDPSLEPAPLALPERKPTTRRRRMTSDAALPTASSSSRRRRRQGQVIPYELRGREHVQLNYAVLVDEEPAVEEPLPGFLAPRETHDDGGGPGPGPGPELGLEPGRARAQARGEEEEQEEEAEEADEFDALEWATRARVAELPMSEDLRRVVLEGLGWMEGQAGGFI